MGFFDKIKEIVTESDDDEYDDFYEDNKGGSVGIAPPIRDRFSRRESSSNESCIMSAFLFSPNSFSCAIGSVFFVTAT